MENVEYDTQPVVESAERAPEFISDGDRAILEMTLMKQQLAKVEAEKALAQNATAELTSNYLLLQLYVKYGLNTATDGITGNGQIQRGLKGNK